MDWTTRRKSIVFSMALLIVSGGFVAAAVADANGTLAPLRAGFDWATERPLTRNMASLTVLAGELHEDDVTRVAAADVRVLRPDAAGESVVVAEGATGADGRFVLELVRGPYFVEVAWNGSRSQNGLNLERSERLGAYLDVATRDVFWRSIPHDDLENGGDVATLLVRVDDEAYCGTTEGGNRLCQAVPAPGATIDVYEYANGERGERVTTTTTKDQSAARVVLPVGAYAVDVTLDGRMVTHDVRLVCDYHLAVRYDGEKGEVEGGGCPRTAAAVASG